jgi:hypothetical protein
MMRNLLVCIALLLLVASCGAQDPPVVNPIENFTITDSVGRIVSNDPDDWRIQERYRNEAEVLQPAFQNPTRTGIITFTIRYALSTPIARVDFVGNNSFGNPTLFFTDTNIPQFGAKNYSFSVLRFSPNAQLADLQGKLFRLRMIDGIGNLITYGDIKFQ